jgi:GNAT superfamily N-acetyltransferase
MTAALRGRAAAELLDADLLSSILGADVERFVGPAAIAYADAADFVPADERGTRLLGPDDEAALRALAEASGETSWEHSGIEFDRAPVFGCFAAGELAAAASYEVLGGTVAHVGFVTHPAHRGRGLGRAVASAATGQALAAGLIAQWQTLESNAPSTAVGRALGFRPYCRTLAIRLN